jgi:acetyl esterase/lipase
MKKVLLLLTVVVTVLASCSKTGKGEDENAAKEMKNVQYGADALQNMDIYLPPNRSTIETKAIVLVHGGAWMSGDKEDFDSTVMVLKQQLPNYAIFNINYRLAALPSTNMWPTQLNDVNSAFDFIISKAEEYKFNSNKMVIGGASAGGHLALLKAYRHNNNNRIKAMVDLFGPTEMKDLYNSNASYSFLFNAFLGGTPQTNPNGYRNASPLYDVKPGVPPTIIFHGGADMVVPKAQSDSLKNRLQNVAVPHAYHVYPTEGHGWYGANLQDTYQKLIAFIQQHNP